MGRMKAEARRYFWWPSLDKNIENMVRQCSSCAENDKQPVKAPLQQWSVPSHPWKRIHIDFMGKFMNYYFLVVVDAYSKWLETFIMNDISTSATIKILMTLFARYGLCEEIVSDNGTQFTSDEFQQFCMRNGIRHTRSAPGHPQSNGQAERYVGILKSALKKGLARGGKINDVLSKFLFCYRTTPHSSTNLSPAELFLKRQLRTVFDLLRPNAEDALEATRLRYKKNFDRHTKQRRFCQSEKVLIRDYRRNSTKVEWTPGILIDRQGSRMWNVQVGDQRWKRHEDQMKHRDWVSDNEQNDTDQTQLMMTTNDDHSQSIQATSSIPTSSSRRQSVRFRKPVRRLINEI